MRAGRLVARARRPRRDLGRRRQPVRTARGDGSGCARDLDRIASRHGARRGPLRRGAGSGRGPRGRRRAGGVASPLDPVRRRLPRRGGLAVPQRVLRQPRALRPRRAGRSGGHRRRRDVGCRGAGRRSGSRAAEQGASLPGSFVEVHIEQGPVLERSGSALGVVSAIAGMADFMVEFTGETGHAGTVPMAERRDAFVAAADFALRLRDAASALAGAVATVGERAHRRSCRERRPRARAPDGRRPGARERVARRARRFRRRTRRRVGRTGSLLRRRDADVVQRAGSALRAHPRGDPRRRRRAGHRRQRAAVGCGPRCRRPRRGRRRGGHAVRAQPERRRQPPSRRAQRSRAMSSVRSRCWPARCASSMLG